MSRQRRVCCAGWGDPAHPRGNPRARAV